MTPSLSFRGPIILGLAALILLLAGFGSWAVLARLQGAVILQGQVVVQDSRQTVQHPEGGVVEAVFVRDGTLVAKGDPLLRLQGADLLSKRRIVEARLISLSARAARLEAERDGRADLAFPNDLLAQSAGLAESEAELAGQTRLFHLRLALFEQAGALLRQRIAQLETQGLGLQAEQAALQDELSLVKAELADQQALLDAGLATEGPLLALEREDARLRGQMAALEVAMTQSQGQITETSLRMANLRIERIEAAAAELREIEPQIAELSETLETLSTRIDALVIRAPVSGRVLALRVPKPDVVLQPGEDILSLVPQDAGLVISARLGPDDVDSVFPGQPVEVAVSALVSGSAPRLQARVQMIAADTVTDPESGAVFYLIELALEPGEGERLGPGALKPGMRVEAFLATRARSPMTYLVEPFTAFFTHALRES